MKTGKPYFVIFIIMIAEAFVQPPLLEPHNPAFTLSPLHNENVNPKTVSKAEDTVSKVSAESNSVERSHTKFLNRMKSHYVDKTLFIKDVLAFGPRVTLITRPRGFGKSLALSSVYYYCDHLFKNATGLFSGLKIMESNELSDVIREKYMSKFSVIWVDFGKVKHVSYEENLIEIKRAIGNAFQTHSYLLEGTLLKPHEKKKFQQVLDGQLELHEIGMPISYLSITIFQFTNKTSIILIDNYDTPFVTGWMYNYYERISGVMKDIYDKTLLEDFGASYRYILTGVTKIAHPGMKKVTPFTILGAPVFSDSFGFTDKEVEELLNRTGSGVQFQPLKDRYGGYWVENQSIFNPSSVINELSGKPFEWAETELKEVTGKVMMSQGMYPILTIQQLLAGERVTRNLTIDIYYPHLTNFEVLYWSYLAHSGYVAAAKIPEETWKGGAWLSIPNLEVRKVIETSIEAYSRAISWKIPDYNQFIDNLTKGNVESAQTSLDAYLQRAGRYLPYQMQNVLLIYVVQMLRGVEVRYNTKIKMTRRRKGVILEVEPKNAEGQVVRMTLLEAGAFGVTWQRLKSKICSKLVPLIRPRSEIFIIVQKKKVNSCVNFLKRIG